eukprot:scaffold34303_cov49-Attheya_sp.AAC.1
MPVSGLFFFFPGDARYGPQPRRFGTGTYLFLFVERIVERVYQPVRVQNHLGPTGKLLLLVTDRIDIQPFAIIGSIVCLHKQRGRPTPKSPPPGAGESFFVSTYIRRAIRRRLPNGIL